MTVTVFLEQAFSIIQLIYHLCFSQLESQSSSEKNIQDYFSDMFISKLVTRQHSRIYTYCDESEKHEYIRVLMSTCLSSELVHLPRPLVASVELSTTSGVFLATFQHIFFRIFPFEDYYCWNASFARQSMGVLVLPQQKIF